MGLDIRRRGIAGRRGLISERPPASLVPEGFQFYAEDQDGGQNYEKHSGVWVKRGPAVNDPGSNLLDEVVLGSNWSPAYAAGDQDIPGLVLQVTTALRPIIFKTKVMISPLLGTAASPSLIRHQVKLKHNSDGAGTWVIRDTATITTKVTTGEQYFNTHIAEWTYTPAAAGELVQVKVTLTTNVANSQWTVWGAGAGARCYLRADQK